MLVLVVPSLINKCVEKFCLWQSVTILFGLFLACQILLAHSRYLLQNLNLFVTLKKPLVRAFHYLHCNVDVSQAIFALPYCGIVSLSESLNHQISIVQDLSYENRSIAFFFVLVQTEMRIGVSR